MSKHNFFEICHSSPACLARAGLIRTKHGVIHTPAFVVVGTKATVKALTPDQVADLGAEAVLANTYHLYLEPGADRVAQAGGLNRLMNWSGPSFTDSGGFQVFSLGAAYGEGGVSKFASQQQVKASVSSVPKLAKVNDEGVLFRSHLDGSEHFFTPAKSIQIQHQLGADIIFAFDECTSPLADLSYQTIALDRTHRWAEQSLVEHQRLGGDQALFGIVQGGCHQALRQHSARFISQLPFAGFGIGGSFTEGDMGTAVRWVNEILPVDKPRHLLGIGAVADLLAGVTNGADTFDCVAPTRQARNGCLETKWGRINILNSRYRDDWRPLSADCDCYTCRHYTRAYLAHLFRSKEMLAGTLASIHNLRFFVNLVATMRQKIITDDFLTWRDAYLADYLSNKVD